MDVLYRAYALMKARRHRMQTGHRLVTRRSLGETVFCGTCGRLFYYLGPEGVR